MRLLEASIFFAVALAVHAAALTLLPERDGATQGAESVSVEITPQPATLTALVAAWDNSPEVAETPQALTAPAAQQSMQPAAPLSQVTPTELVALAQSATPPDRVEINTALPAPRTIAPAAPDAMRMPDLPTLQLPSARPMTAPERASGSVQPKAEADQSTALAPLLPAQPHLQGLPAAPQAHVAPATRAATLPDRAADAADNAPSRQRYALGTPSRHALLPQIDTAPAAQGLAPGVSLMPRERPEGLAPQIAQAQTKTKPKIKTKTVKSTKKAPAKVSKPKSSGTAKAAKPSTKKAAGKPKPKAKSAPQKTASAGQTRQAMAKWGGQISAAVARAKGRPKSRSGGRATLRLTISRSGKLLGVKLVRSSGNKTLDAAAIKAAKRARYPRAPKALTKKSYSFNQPVRFSAR